MKLFFSHKSRTSQIAVCFGTIIAERERERERERESASYVIHARVKALRGKSYLNNMRDNICCPLSVLYPATKCRRLTGWKIQKYNL
jgi:hypothetical protein